MAPASHPSQEHGGTAAEAPGVVAVRRWLADHGVEHGVVEHERTYSAQAEAFPAFEVGALPPFGPMLPAPEIVDPHLLYHERILCAAGDHRHGVLLDPRDLVRVAEPRVADICQPELPQHDTDFADLPRL